MTRLSMINSPFLLGFEHIERTLDRLSKGASDSYPPYNIEQTAEDRLRITLAIAGFSGGDLSISVNNNQLIVRGQQEDDETGRIFLHRGIAARKFQRSFVLAQGIEVIGAELDNGLLHIDLARPVPEARIKTIAIRSASHSGNGLAVDKTLAS